MIGRGAIRNPWIFRQIREQRRGTPVFRPIGHDVLAYIHALYEAVSTPGIRESAQINNMKKYLNFIGLGVEPTGEFLDHGDPMPLEPFTIAFNSKDVMAGVTR